jgi:hypothetical protein
MTETVDTAKESDSNLSFQDEYTQLHTKRVFEQPALSTYESAIETFGQPRQGYQYVMNPDTRRFENITILGNTQGYRPNFMGWRKIQNQFWEDAKKADPRKLGSFHEGGSSHRHPHALNRSVISDNVPALRSVSPDFSVETYKKSPEQIKKEETLKKYEEDRALAYTEGVSEKLFRNIVPQGYGDISTNLDRWRRYKGDLGRNKDELLWYGAAQNPTGRDIYYEIPKRDDMFRLYLGMPQENNSFVPQLDYRPSNEKDPNSLYWKPSYWDDKMKQSLLNDYFLFNVLDDKVYNERSNVFRPKQDSLENVGVPSWDPETAMWVGDNPLGDFSVTRGKDDKGDYISIYDIIDFNPFQGSGEGSSVNPYAKGLLEYAKTMGIDVTEDSEGASFLGAGKPYEIYDRIYFDPETKKIKTFHEGGYVHRHPHAEMPVSTFTQGAPSGHIYTDTEATLPDYASQAFFGNLQEEQKIQEALAEPGPTVNKAKAVAKVQDKERKKVERQIEAIESGDIESYYSYIKGKEGRDKAIAEAEHLKAVAESASVRENGPWNNWGDAPVGHVAIAPWLLGLGAANQVGKAGINALMRSSIGQGTKAALRTPVGKGLMFAPEAYFASDFLVNRAPSVAQDIYRGEADWDTAGEAAMGALDLAGVGMLDNVTGAIGKGVRSIKDEIVQSKAARAFNVGDYRRKLGEETDLTRRALEDLSFQIDEVIPSQISEIQSVKRAKLDELKVKEAKLKGKAIGKHVERKTDRYHFNEEGVYKDHPADSDFTAPVIDPTTGKPSEKGKLYIQKKKEVQRLERRYESLQKLKALIDEKKIKVLEDGTIEAINSNVYKDLGTMKDNLSGGVDNHVIDLATGNKVPIEINVPESNAVYRLDNSGIQTKIVREIKNPSKLDYTVNDEYWEVLNKNKEFVANKIKGSKPYGSSVLPDLGVVHATDDIDVVITRADYTKNVEPLLKNGELSYSYDGTKPRYGHTVYVGDPKVVGNSGKIDVNIIEENSEGFASGEFAQELYRQLYPQKFYDAQKALSEKYTIEANKFFKTLDPGISELGLSNEMDKFTSRFRRENPLKLDVTPKQLVDEFDSVKKSIQDAYEATPRIKSTSVTSGKVKHTNRIDYLIENADPIKLKEGQEAFLKSLVGEKGSLGYQFSKSQLTDVDANLKLLDRISPQAQNKAKIAGDPDRMQVALNDFYINNSVYTREISINPKLINDLEDLESAFLQWKQGKSVGEKTRGGGGLNVVRLGEPWFVFGDHTIKGQIQTKAYDLGKSYNTAGEYVNDVLKYSSGSRVFDEAEREVIKGLMKKHGISSGYNDDVPVVLQDIMGTSRNTGAHNSFDGFVQNLDDPEQATRLVNFVKEASKELGFNAVARALKNPKEIKSFVDHPEEAIFGTGQFAVLVNTSKDQLQAFSFAFKDMVPKIKSYLERLENISNYNTTGTAGISGFENISILNDNVFFAMDKAQESVVQFNALEGYLRGGIEALEKRLLTNQDMEAAIARIVSKKGKKIDPSSLNYDQLMQSKLKHEKELVEKILYDDTASKVKIGKKREEIIDLSKKEIDRMLDMQTQLASEKTEINTALNSLKRQENELKEYRKDLIELGLISSSMVPLAAGAYMMTQESSDKTYDEIWEERRKKEEEKKALNEIEIKQYRKGGMVIAPTKVMISKPSYEHGGLHLDSDTPMSAFGQRLAQSRVSSTPKKKKTLKEQFLEDSLQRQEEAAGISGNVDRGETLQNVSQTYVGGSDLGSAKDQKRATDAEIAAKKKAVAQKVYADMTKDSQYHQKNFSMADAEKVVENMGDNWSQYYKDKGLGLREVDAIRDPGDDYNQSAWSRFGDYFWNPLDAFEYSVRTGDFRNMPKNYSAYEAGLAQTGESGFTDGNLLSKGLELATYAAPAGLFGNAIKGTRAARVMPWLSSKAAPYAEKVFNWSPNTYKASQKAYDLAKAAEMQYVKGMRNINKALGRKDAFYRYRNRFDNMQNPYGLRSGFAEKAQHLTGNALMNASIFWNTLPKQVLDNKFLTNASWALHAGAQAPLIAGAIESGDPYDWALAAANTASLGSSAGGYLNRRRNPYNTKYGSGLVRPEDLRMEVGKNKTGYQWHAGTYRPWQVNYTPEEIAKSDWKQSEMNKSLNFDPDRRIPTGTIQLSWNEQMHAANVAKKLWNNKAIRNKYEQIFGEQPRDWYDNRFLEFAAVEGAKQAPVGTRYIGAPETDVRGKSKYSYLNFLTDQGISPSALQVGKLWEWQWGDFKHPKFQKNLHMPWDAAEKYSQYLQEQFGDAFQSQFPQTVLVNRLDNLDYTVQVNRNGQTVTVPIQDLNPGEEFKLSQPWATSAPWSTANLGSEDIKGDIGSFGKYRVTIDAPTGTGFYSAVSNVPHYASERELVLPQESWIRVKSTEGFGMEAWNKNAINPTTPAMRFEIVSPDEFAPELSTPANPAKEQALKELAEKDLGISDVSSNKGLTSGPEWLKPSKEKLKQEYYVEHQLKKNNFFPTEDSFMKAIDEGEMVEITPEIDKTIGYRSRTQSKEDLINLSKTYASWPEFRNEKTIDAIYEGISAGKTMDMPIVLQFPDGTKRVFSGNTRMDVSFQKGQNPKVLLIKVPGKTQFRFGGQTLNRMHEGGSWHAHDQYGNHYAGTASMNSGAAFFGGKEKIMSELGPTVAKAKVLEAEKKATNKVLRTDDKTLLQKVAQPILENLSNLDTSEGYNVSTESLLNALTGRTKYLPWRVGAPGGAESAALSAYFNVHPERVNKFFEPSNYMPNAVQPKGFYKAHADTLWGDFPSYVNKYLRDPLYANEQVNKIMRQEYPTDIYGLPNVIDPTKIGQVPTIPFTPKMTKDRYRKEVEKKLRRDEIYSMIDAGKPWDNMVLGRYSVTPGFDPTRGLNYLQYHDINNYDTHWLGNILDKFNSPFDIAGRIYFKQQVTPFGDTLNIKVPESKLRGYRR